MIRIRAQGPRLSEEDVTHFEKRIGSPLPEPYRRFLLENNGGRTTPDTIHVEGLPGSPTDIKVLFSIGSPEETNDLLWNREMFTGRIPDRFLPIASDSGGSRFCVSLSGSDRGSVVFCLLTFTEDDGTIYFVASDFDDFLSKIVPFEPTLALN
jgi:cell wall assembly regulator SMI1